MDLSAFKTQLETAGSLVQVIEASPGGFDVPVDSGAELYTLLSGLVGNRVYPVTAEDNTTLSHIIYTLIGTDSLEFEGFRIAQTDRFVLTLRTADYSGMVSLVNSIVTAIRSSSYAIDLVDYEQTHEPEFTAGGAYRTDIEIEFTYLIDAAGGPSSAFSSELPLALIYPVGRSADESEADNLIFQRVNNQYAIVVAATSGMPALLDEIKGVMLGWQPSTEYHDMEYVSGANLGGVGTMQLWREIYMNWHMFEET